MSLTRATSLVRISSPVTDTTPCELRAGHVLARDAAVDRADLDARHPLRRRFIALAMARVVSSMSRTTPRRTPGGSLDADAQDLGAPGPRDRR